MTYAYFLRFTFLSNEDITNFMVAARNRPEALSLLLPLTDLPDLFWCLPVWLWLR